MRWGITTAHSIGSRCLVDSIATRNTECSLIYIRLSKLHRAGASSEMRRETSWENVLPRINSFFLFTSSLRKNKKTKLKSRLDSVISLVGGSGQRHCKLLQSYQKDNLGMYKKKGAINSPASKAAALCSTRIDNVMALPLKTSVA